MLAAINSEAYTLPLAGAGLGAMETKPVLAAAEVWRCCCCCCGVPTRERTEHVPLIRERKYRLGQGLDS